MTLPTYGVAQNLTPEEAANSADLVLRAKFGILGATWIGRITYVAQHEGGPVMGIVDRSFMPIATMRPIRDGDYEAYMKWYARHTGA